MNQKLFTILIVLLCAILLNYYFLREAFTDSGEIKDKGIAKLVSGFTEDIPTTMGTKVVDSRKSSEEKKEEKKEEKGSSYVTQEALDSQMTLQQKLLEAQTQKIVKDEILARRAMENVKEGKSLGSFASDPKTLNPKKSLEQGSTFQSLTKDPKVVCPYIDRSKYIRRDQIPCWNCNLTPDK